jgi:DNA-binding GntR family transcriptional regulator
MLAMVLRLDGFQAVRGATPMYKQLAAFIIAAIRRGDLEPGDQIPAERRLAEMTGHSVDMVRQAMGMLRDLGYAETGHGTGTFVTTPDRWPQD